MKICISNKLPGVADGAVLETYETTFGAKGCGESVNGTLFLVGSWETEAQVSQTGSVELSNCTFSV